MEAKGPEEVGVEERTPDFSRIEGAQLLADQARESLRREGFTDEEIRKWAETFVAERGSGDLEVFLDWIRAETGPRHV
ncbi:MAG: hypothetical protein ACRD02_03890 [Acidimicrobiia bacterium]